MTTIGLLHTSITGMGGAERVAICVARSLIKHNYYVKLFTVNKGDVFFRNGMLGAEFPHGLELDQVSVRHTVNHFGLYKRLLGDNIVKQIQNECDLIIQTDGWYQALKPSKCKRIAYCQAIWSTEPHGKYSRGPWRIYFMPYAFILQKRLEALRNQDRVVLVANSEYTKRYLENKFALSNIPVIYPPLNIDVWKTKTSMAREGIVHLSRFSEEKNHMELFEIVKEMDTIVKVLGSANNLREEEYYRYLAMNVLSNVRLYPNVGHEEILHNLHKAKVFLNASHETFGLTVVEAIAAGCIPVVPNHSGNKETVPFRELRYDNIAEAKDIIRRALGGAYDHLFPVLQEHIKIFEEKTFEKHMLALVNWVLHGS